MYIFKSHGCTSYLRPGRCLSPGVVPVPGHAQANGMHRELLFGRFGRATNIHSPCRRARTRGEGGGGGLGGHQEVPLGYTIDPPITKFTPEVVAKGDELVMGW